MDHSKRFPNIFCQIWHHVWKTFCPLLWAENFMRVFKECMSVFFFIFNHFKRNLHFMREKKFLQSVNSRAMLNPQYGGGVRKYLLTSIHWFYWLSDILTQENKNFLFLHKKSTFKVARTCKNSLKTILFILFCLCPRSI